MDSNLNISVTLDRGGIRTIEDLDKYVRGLGKAYKQLPIDAKDAQIQMGKQISALKDYQRSLTETTLSSNAKMKESYFQLGQQIRQQAAPSVMEFTRVIQDAPMFMTNFRMGMMSIGNNVQQLSGNFSTLSRNVGGMVPAIKAMMSSMLTGPMALMVGVSVVTALATAFGDYLFPSAKKANDELDKTRETLDKISRLSVELGEDVFGSARKGKLQGEYLASASAFYRMVPRRGFGAGAAALPMEQQSKEYQSAYLAMQEAKKAFAEFEQAMNQKTYSSVKGLYDQEKARLDVIQKQNDEYEKQLKLTAGQEYGYAKGMSRNMMLGPRGTQISGLQFLGTGGFNKNTAMAGQGGIPMMGGAEYQSPRVTFGEWMSYSMDFQSAFMSGIGSISSSISSQIGGAFASVFGGAKTLLGNFVGMFMQALAEMAMRAAALFAFSSIFGAVSIGTGGAAVGAGFPVASGGNAGAIGIGLAQSRSRINNLNINVPEIAARIENDAIVLAYERGKLVRQNRIL